MGLPQPVVESAASLHRITCRLIEGEIHLSLGRYTLRAPVAPMLLAAALTGCGGGANDPPSAEVLAARCAQLKGRVFASVTVTETRRLPAASGVNPHPVCQVLGTRAPFLDIEVDVPDNWGGRVVHQGGGGFDGAIPSALTKNSTGTATAVSPTITSGRAVYVASNGGNRTASPVPVVPAVWTMGTAASEASIADYAHKAIGTSIAFGKTIARELHGRGPSYTYFIGCSNGGRNGYSAAERYAAEYDGIVSGCQNMNFASQTAAWLGLASKSGTPAAPTQPQFRAAFAAATAACDPNDGIADGVIADPSACDLSPMSLVCGAPGADPDPSLCLSTAQAQTMQGMFTDVVLNDGSKVYTGYTWTDFGFLAPFFETFGGGFAFLATGDASWMTRSKQATFDLNRDYPIFAAGLRAREVDQDKAAIAAFVASGKKLISWHGGTDSLLSVGDHARRFGEMTAAARSLGLADPRQNARFFVVPGASHTRGERLTEIDWFTAITEWVEAGRAPSQLEYKFNAGGTGRALPVCEHPKYPRYNGTGDRNAANSYTCTNP